MSPASTALPPGLEGKKKMKITTYAPALGVALTLAGTAQAQDFQVKEKGLLMLNVRATAISPTADDAITTAGGAPTGLHVDVKDDYKPSLGLSYFLTDHVAVEVIATTSQHTTKAQGPGTDVTVHKTWVLPPVGFGYKF